jgi:hypothetical protein
VLVRERQQDAGRTCDGVQYSGIGDVWRVTTTTTCRRQELDDQGLSASQVVHPAAAKPNARASHRDRDLLVAFCGLEASLYTPCPALPRDNDINTTANHHAISHLLFHCVTTTRLILLRTQPSVSRHTTVSAIADTSFFLSYPAAAASGHLHFLPVPIGGSARNTNLLQHAATYDNLRSNHFRALRHKLAMDSMRHLSSSLPGTRRRNEQPQQLLSDFKAAALSVTNLYKTATAENGRSREAGYQDALDDLLAFLDKENMGLMDGEGWRVRRWATERLDDAPKGNEDEEDGSKEEAVETRSSSPEVQRKSTVPTASSSLMEEEHQRPASEPPQHATQYQLQPPQPTPSHAASPAPLAAPALDDFSFRSAQAYPTNHNREDNTTMDVDPTSTNSARPAPKASSRSRHTNHARSRDNNRSSVGPTFNFNLGSGAGGKRKMPYPDFFDISGLNPESGNDNSRRDGGGRGGKKGRHV